MQVIELRSYLLREGATRDFIRYFEEHFLLSQRAEGMHPLGQFEVVDEPDRFVWIRGFDDMRTRLRGLSAFYGGPFWQARRSEANTMMLEHHNVHLLRPLGPIVALTGGAALEDRASEPPGALPPHTGLVVADFYHAEPAGLGGLVELFEQRVQPALIEQGHHVLGHFVAELGPNDYPRLPVIQDDTLFVVLSAYRDREHCDGMRHDWRRSGPVAGGGMDALLTREMVSSYLRPTAKSLIRYRGQGASQGNVQRRNEMELFVFARFHARPGNEGAVAEALLDVLAPTREEPGCLRIHDFRSIRDPQLFYVHSRWKDEAAFDHHAGLPHTVRFLERVEPLIDHPLDVTRAEQID